MRAFISGTVTKQQLLDSLQQHRDRDAFHQGTFWNDDKQTGCGVGCSIHDFAPGAESDHSQYETLFGIPARAGTARGTTSSRPWPPPTRPTGPSPSPTPYPKAPASPPPPPRWLLAILTSEASPLVHARHMPRVATPPPPGPMAGHRHHRPGRPPQPDEQPGPALQPAVQPRSRSSIAHRPGTSTSSRQTGPYTISDMNTLDMVVCQAARSYGYRAADEHPSEQAAHAVRRQGPGQHAPRRHQRVPRSPAATADHPPPA